MDDSMTGVHEFNLASRKAEEAACRRFQATAWLDGLVGPLKVSSQPSEREFISCLRNGLILCKAINKIHPGAVLKVVDKTSPLPSLTWESQTLPAFQYFENVRNFLVAAQELKLPAFEASDLELDHLESGSVCKVVDCILALKLHHEGKQVIGENGLFKHARSPMILPSAGKAHSCAPVVPFLPQSRRHLDLEMSAVPASEKQLPDEDTIIKALANHMFNSKENIDENLMVSLRNGDLDTTELFSKIMCKDPELKAVFKDHLMEGTDSFVRPVHNSKDLKALLSNTKREFEDLESQFETDLKLLGSRVQEMSSAALGYAKVMKENRTLYNLVQDLKGNIRVYCRIRPAFGTEAKSVINYIGGDGSLVILDPLKPKKDGRKVFQFNRVFGPSSTQDEIFKDTQPLIRSVMDGYNVCILAYGQTGSGKTHTMYGPSDGSVRDTGINYQALKDLFEMSSRRKDLITYDIHVQMVEIYNEQVRDLLTEDSSATKIEIRSCTAAGGLSLPDATMHSVKSSSDVLSLMKLGEVNRVVSSTAINNRSSRSHSIVTVHVHGKDTSGNITRSCLHLVDLAGSERVEKSEVTGDRLKEAQHINKSLSCLGDVIAALAQKNSHIPYRNSKLTLLLQDSLGGRAKTLMFAHVSPEGDSFGETVSTLKFAQRVSTVELGAAQLNKESGEIMELKEQIESLKKALANKEGNGICENTTPRSRRLSIENVSSMKLKTLTDRTPTRTRRLSIENSSSAKPKATTERTPPRSRRLSIENGSSAKPKATTERTPPRSRRLSIENGSSVKPKVTTGRTPPRQRRLSIENGGSVKPKVRTEGTPPHSRRLSIENGSTVKADKVSNLETKKGTTTPAVLTRARRLSLEGLKHNSKKDLADNESESVNQPLPFDMLSSQNNVQFEETDLLSKSYQHFSSGDFLTGACNHTAAPPSPLSFAYKSRTMKRENGANGVPVQLLKTPVPTIISTDGQKHAIMSNGKGSQIKRSLRSIGKLINGSEKKNQPNLIDIRTPINSTIYRDDRKAPLTVNARALRRRSLTGLPENSRRSSLGGNTIDSSIGNRNSCTPPPSSPLQDSKSMGMR